MILWTSTAKLRLFGVLRRVASHPTDQLPIENQTKNIYLNVNCLYVFEHWYVWIDMISPQLAAAVCIRRRRINACTYTHATIGQDFRIMLYVCIYVWNDVAFRIYPSHRVG